MPDPLRSDLQSQRTYVEPRSPAYGRLLAHILDVLDEGLEARLEIVWKGRTFRAWYERPLLILASLRHDALRDGPDHPLWRAIGAPEPDPEAATEEALAAALAPDREVWDTLARRYVQTNEPTRAVAWMWPAHVVGQALPDQALSIFDVGASAGLNLIADHLDLRWTAQDGDPIPVTPLPRIVERVGFDLRPLDVRDEVDARWIKACVWPGQWDREGLLSEAIATFRALQSAPDAPTLQRTTAGDVPGALPTDAERSFAIVYQTVLRDYLPADERDAYESGMREWLDARPRASALWVELEITDAAREGGPPAALTAHVRGTGGLESWTLAHCEPHPVRLDIDSEAVAALRDALSAAN